MRDLIALFHSGHPNDYESADSARRTFAEFGLRIVDFALTRPDIAPLLNAFMTEHMAEVRFFMSANYHAARVGDGTRLLHTLTGIPLVIMMHDHPLYFLDEQIAGLADVIVFAPGEDLPGFIDTYYPHRAETIARVGARPQVEHAPPAYEQFLERDNVVLAPINLAINGLTLDAAWQHIKALPAERRERAKRLAERALTDTRTPLHVLAEQTAPGLSREQRAREVKDLLLVLNFLKLWRRNRLIRGLIELPITISSEYVPADLEFRYPDKFTLLSRKNTIPLYRRYRFTLNSHPVLTHVFHDRVLDAVFGNSVCITDANAVVARSFTHGVDMLFYDLANDDIAAPIVPYLDDAAAAYALTVRADAVRAANGDFVDSYRALLAAVDARWEAAGGVALAGAGSA